MKHLFNSSLRLWHLIAFGVILVLFGGGAVALADTEAITGFWASGQVRLASSSFSSSDPSIDISGTGTEKEILNASFVVPEGKKADLQATFSADLHHNGASGLTTYAYCFGKFALDGINPDAKFHPDQYQLLGGDTAHEPSALTVTMTGWRKNIPAGTHTVRVFVNAAYNGCQIQAANLNVVANVR